MLNSVKINISLQLGVLTRSYTNSVDKCLCMDAKKPRINIYVDENEYEKLQAIAAKQKRKLSNLVNLIITEYLEKHIDDPNTRNT